MVPTSLYESVWKLGLEPELIDYTNGLNWTYILTLIIIFYGVKHTDKLDWWGGFLIRVDNKLKKFKVSKYNMWFSSIVIFILFIIFRELEQHDVNASYISMNLRSMVFSVIFSNIFVDIPVYVIKGFSKFIDTKSEKSN
jgi:hypothetical protein